MPRERQPHEALKGWSQEIRNVIRRLRQRAMSTINYHVSYQQLWDAMYPLPEHDVLKSVFPRLFSIPGQDMRVLTNDGYEAHMSAGNYVEAGTNMPRPVFAKQDKWAGPDAEKFTALVTDIASQKRAVDAQWQDVSSAFEALNNACRDANQLYSMWPPLLQLAEKAGMSGYRLREIGEYKPVRNPPVLAPHIYDYMRSSIPIVGMAMIMPDDIEPNQSPVYIGA